MNIGLIRQHKHLLLIGSLLFLMTNTALAGSLPRCDEQIDLTDPETGIKIDFVCD